MSDLFSSLPRFPVDAQEKLPPPRRDWGELAVAITVFVVGGGVALLVCYSWPMVLIFFILPGSGFVLGPFGFGCLLVFIHVWQRSEEIDR